MFKNFENSTKALMAVVMAMSLTGCGSAVIEQGNFSLSRTMLTGKYSQEANTSAGFTLGVISSQVEFNGKEIVVPIENIRPKDKDNVMLDDLDLNITYKVNPTKAQEFIVKTGDIIAADSKSSSDAEVIGYHRMEIESKSLIGDTTKKFSSEQILDNSKNANGLNLEDQFKVDLQQKMNDSYGKDTFEIVSVRIGTPKVSPIIEQKIQQIATIEAEKAKNNATNMVLENREKTLTKEYQVLVNSAKNSGLSIDQALEYEYMKIIKENDIPIQNNKIMKNKP